MGAFRLITRMADLDDVSIDTPAEADVASYNAATQKWVNRTLAAAGIAAASHAHAASDITSGTLSDSRLSANVLLLTGTQSITGQKRFGNSASIDYSVAAVQPFASSPNCGIYFTRTAQNASLAMQAESGPQLAIFAPTTPTTRLFYTNQSSLTLGGSGSTHTISQSLITSTTANTSAADMVASWVTNTHGSQRSRATWRAYDTSPREGIRIESTGSAAAVGLCGAVSANSNEVMVNGTLEATGLRVNASTSAPSFTAYADIATEINSYYGGAASPILGSPNAWLSVNVNGTTRKIPCY